MHSASMFSQIESASIGMRLPVLLRIIVCRRLDAVHLFDHCQKVPPKHYPNRNRWRRCNRGLIALGLAVRMSV